MKISPCNQIPGVAVGMVNLALRAVYEVYQGGADTCGGVEGRAGEEQMKNID